MIRLAIFVFLVIVVYKLLSRLLKGAGVSDRGEVSGDRSTADLVQDPQCGAYILPAQAVKAKLGGKSFHFCSESCKGKYLLAQSEKSEETSG
jgi:YHS domain-containing protein